MVSVCVKETITTTKYRYELYREDILTFNWDDVPSDAEIYMYVPGGGDWSNVRLDTTNEPLIVSWEKVTRFHDTDCI